MEHDFTRTGSSYGTHDGFFAIDSDKVLQNLGRGLCGALLQRLLMHSHHDLC